MKTRDYDQTSEIAISVAQMAFKLFHLFDQNEMTWVRVPVGESKWQFFLACFMLQVLPRILSDKNSFMRNSFMGQDYIWYSTKRWEKKS